MSFAPYKATGHVPPTQAVWPIPASHYFKSDVDYSGLTSGLQFAEEAVTLGALVGATDSTPIGPEARGPLSTSTILLWGAVAFVSAGIFYGVVR